jgi:hypothetical protein
MTLPAGGINNPAARGSRSGVLNPFGTNKKQLSSDWVMYGSRVFQPFLLFLFVV